MTQICNPILQMFGRWERPKKLSGLVNKAFGNLVIEQRLSEYREEYRVYDFKESIRLTEGKDI